MKTDYFGVAFSEGKNVGRDAIARDKYCYILAASIKISLIRGNLAESRQILN